MNKFENFNEELKKIAEKQSFIPEFYSDIFNTNQSLFMGWQLRTGFSEYELEHIKSKASESRNSWIRKELSGIMKDWLPDQYKDFDSRRYNSLYDKGMRYNEIVKTPTLPDSLYFLLKGMLTLHSIEKLDSKEYTKRFPEWEGLFLRINKKDSQFRADIEKVLSDVFVKPLPKKRSYQGIIFSGYLLFRLLKYLPPEDKTGKYKVFVLLMFKSVFNLCFDLPFEFPVTAKIIEDFELLQHYSRKSSFEDNPFLSILSDRFEQQLKSNLERNYLEPPSHKCPDNYICELTRNFSETPLCGLAQQLSSMCGEDTSHLIELLIKQASIGLTISERTDEKAYLENFLRKNIDNSDLAYALYLIVSGLNSYSAEDNYQKTSSLNLEKNAKKDVR